MAAKNYNTIIDQLNQLQPNTIVAEKRRAMKDLGEFLKEQGYEQLGDAVIKARLTVNNQG